MGTALVAFHFFICVFLMVLILLQAGKGADIGAAFGGASQTVFGGRGPATFLSKLTTIAAVLFMISSITLAHLSKTTTIKSVFDNISNSAGVTAPVETKTGAEEKAPASQPAPAAPVQPAGK
jgi:preprotein translocase subunit SecG